MSLLKDYPAVRLLQTDFHALRMGDLLEIADQHIADKKDLLIGVVNVAKIVNSRKNPQLRSALEEADLVVADGAPIVWLSAMAGHRLPERLAGIEIMFELMKRANEKNYRVYFLGAKLEVLTTVVDIVRKEYPGLVVVGYRDGYFTDQQQQNVAQEIKDSKADILFVAITPPKKEIFLGKWRKFMNIPVCHGVGGSFDVLAGVTKRAPVWMQKSGLEWFYRVIQEPKRLWKRYFFTNIAFVRLSIAEIFRQRMSQLRKKFQPAAVSKSDTSTDENI